MTLHDDNKRQRFEVLRIMADSRWRTLPQLSSALGNRYMTTSLSARLRDFRKEQYGSYRVERRLVPGSDRLYEYRLLPPMGAQAGNSIVPGEKSSRDMNMLAEDARPFTARAPKPTTSNQEAMPAGFVRSKVTRTAASQKELFQ